jgi:hypothetical protein
MMQVPGAVPGQCYDISHANVATSVDALVSLSTNAMQSHSIGLRVLPGLTLSTGAFDVDVFPYHLNVGCAAQVDVNMSLENEASKVSRRQCLLEMDLTYGYILRNIGRQTVVVNNVEVTTGNKVKVPHMSLIAVGAVQLLFMINVSALQRACQQPPSCPKELVGL